MPDPFSELESETSLKAEVPEEVIKTYDPIARARARKKELPKSRYVQSYSLSTVLGFIGHIYLTIKSSYQYRSPKYDRGPLHPHRPPPPSDPHSRLFVPGPFSLPRVEQTYESTIAPDILTLCYVHNPPGFKPPPRPERLRKWDDSSPYHKNRPLRGPRGGDVLRLLRKPIT